MQTITLQRHNQVVADWPKRITARDIPDAIQIYNSAVIDPTQINAVKPMPDIIVCSSLSRSLATASLLYREPHLSDAIFDEAHLPALPHVPFNLSAKAWFAIARWAWLCGYSQDCESVHDFRRRATIASAELIKQAEGGKHVLLMGHGMLNHAVAKHLKITGFNAKSRLSSQHGSFTTFTRK